MTNTELMERWFEEVWNKKNKEAIHEMFASDGVANGLGEEPVIGPEKFAVFHRDFVSAYPDIRAEIVDTVAEGDKVAVRFRVTGLHDGDGLGVRPTKNAVDFTGMTIVRIEGGKIVEAWNNVDFMEMYKQLGVLTLDLE